MTDVDKQSSWTWGVCILKVSVKHVYKVKYTRKLGRFWMTEINDLWFFWLRGFFSDLIKCRSKVAKFLSINFQTTFWTTDSWPQDFSNGIFFLWGKYFSQFPEFFDLFEVGKEALNCQIIWWAQTCWCTDHLLLIRIEQTEHLFEFIFLLEFFLIILKFELSAAFLFPHEKLWNRVQPFRVKGFSLIFQNLQKNFVKAHDLRFLTYLVMTNE